MRLSVGCAMWTHTAWPATGEKLRSYASWCDAVEGNTTFYAVPARRTVEAWAQQTGPDFRFVIKLPKTVTHERRLSGTDAELNDFLYTMEPLGSRMHALWVQLPGTFGPNELGSLAGFLRKVPAGLRVAVEVRHPAFFAAGDAANQLERVLGRAGAEWVPFDTTVLFAARPASSAEYEAQSKKPRLPRRMRALTDTPIVRYHGRDDSEPTVAGWRPWVEQTVEWLREGRSPTVFLHTPDNASSRDLARRFHDEVRAHVPELPPLPDPAETEPMTLF
ncbi:DUF72 domain-containing protein [Nocardia speluncae]|uniref:DUF72 domain-containing protein n=1 Tax=Nocardia speluncae TaxID=419477 RepID=A0A846XFA9_9NOCA|nr:DUF72 domain-containing protein [Nocardia speluncae]NKY35081.1 DUF72 domain-containing protein [Nocardia speluncae]